VTAGGCSFFISAAPPNLHRTFRTSPRDVFSPA
jgi:hypothetical protein